MFTSCVCMFTTCLHVNKLLDALFVCNEHLKIVLDVYSLIGLNAFASCVFVALCLFIG